MPPKKKKVEPTAEELAKRKEYLAKEAVCDRERVDETLQWQLQEPRQAAFDALARTRAVETNNKDPEFFNKISPMIATIMAAYMEAQIITIEHYKAYSEYYPQLPIKAQPLPTERL